ncbi:ribonuclease H-like domain-containing protein [Kockovaella imperatae]|uniref:RNA exonuclease 4 n=1 Tax=Kockovaella imperatae TaxID=4999 RepID=A0A1Y1U821_9TREE|nr:ribonuclease H-like domain-containing protein [Kockovaella imperatae]ORX34180.1 ribonuclease H-like domain-containing protein [Kockovaella imperatae]
MIAGTNVLNESQRAPGKYIAVDCEMVGLGHMGSESALARVSLVNFHGHILLDTFVATRETVTDLRTWVSGVKASDLIGAPTFEEVQKMVAGLVSGKILVGHAVANDLKALLLDHPGPMLRDTQKCPALRERAKSKYPSLRKLTEMELGVSIQKGSHSSVTDARATMALYRLHKTAWEQQLHRSTEAWLIKSAKEGKRSRAGESSGAGQAEAVTTQDEEDSAPSKKRLKGDGNQSGRKGVSSGLGKIVRSGILRVEGKGEKRMARAHGGSTKSSDGGGGGAKWWEASA